MDGWMVFLHAVSFCRRLKIHLCVFQHFLSVCPNVLHLALIYLSSLVYIKPQCSSVSLSVCCGSIFVVSVFLTFLFVFWDCVLKLEIGIGIFY